MTCRWKESESLKIHLVSPGFESLGISRVPRSGDDVEGVDVEVEGVRVMVRVKVRVRVRVRVRTHVSPGVDTIWKELMCRWKGSEPLKIHHMSPQDSSICITFESHSESRVPWHTHDLEGVDVQVEGVRVDPRQRELVHLTHLPN